MTLLDYIIPDRINSNISVTEFRVRRHLLSKYPTGSVEKEALKDKLMKDILESRNVFSEDFFLKSLSKQYSKDAQLTWFWFNHFNTHNTSSVTSYITGTIQPHLYGFFGQMLYSVLKSPAMLLYLNNNENKMGHINENYARELLELHTLGVNGGYTQKDITELAHMLTGIGLRPIEIVLAENKKNFTPKNEFFFDLKNHDTSPRTLLGKVFDNQGMTRIESIIEVISTHPSTANFISNKLCRYILGDDVSQTVIAKVAQVFIESKGNLKKTYEAIGMNDNTMPSRGKSFKEPYRYLVAVGKLLGGENKYKKARPFAEWLNRLGQPLWMHRAPDGYSLFSKDWSNSGQLMERFSIAKEIVATVPSLLEKRSTPDEMLESQVMKDFMNRLGPQTIYALRNARNNSERLELLITSPEIMFG